jgi:hypothetical protein
MDIPDKSGHTPLTLSLLEGQKECAEYAHTHTHTQSMNGSGITNDLSILRILLQAKLQQLSDQLNSEQNDSLPRVTFFDTNNNNSVDLSHDNDVLWESYHSSDNELNDSNLNNEPEVSTKEKNEIGHVKETTTLFLRS